MSGDVYNRDILGTFGGSMEVFETVFRIFISARVLSGSAVDSGYLISLTEVLGMVRGMVFSLGGIFVVFKK